jgi:hypothetical protein
MEPVVEEDRRERADTIKKLVVAGAIRGAGVAANRVLTRENEPPPPRVQPQLIPTVPVHEEERPTEWVANAELRG